MGRRRVASCGTNAGYFVHRRDRTVPCFPCLAAHAAYNRAYKRAFPVPRDRGKCALGLGWPLEARRG